MRVPVYSSQMYTLQEANNCEKIDLYLVLLLLVYCSVVIELKVFRL